MTKLKNINTPALNESVPPKRQVTKQMFVVHTCSWVWNLLAGELE